MKQATSWYAQLVDGTKITGGQQHRFPTDANVNVIPIQALKVFSIGHNTYSDQYYKPWNKWYLSRIETEVTYPLEEYVLADGTILTVDWDYEQQQIKLTQTEYQA